MFHIYLTGLDPLWGEGLPIACALQLGKTWVGGSNFDILNGRKRRAKGRCQKGRIFNQPSLLSP